MAQKLFLLVLALTSAQALRAMEAKLPDFAQRHEITTDAQMVPYFSDVPVTVDMRTLERGDLEEPKETEDPDDASSAVVFNGPGYFARPETTLTHGSIKTISPEAFAQMAGHNPAPRVLFMFWQPIKVLAGIGALRSLQELHLYRTDIAVLPDEVSSLPELQCVFLNHSRNFHTFPAAPAKSRIIDVTGTKLARDARALATLHRKIKAAHPDAAVFPALDAPATPTTDDGAAEASATASPTNETPGSCVVQ